MTQKRGGRGRSRRREDTLPALQVISEHFTALAAGNSEGMNALRSPDFVLDFVCADAFESGTLSVETAQEFWPSWFTAFPEMDYHVTRTIAAENVIVAQWVFTGTHAGPLGPPIFEERVGPTGRTVRLRGVSIFDVSEGLIRRETTYTDLATLWVELGVES